VTVSVSICDFCSATPSLSARAHTQRWPYAHMHILRLPHKQTVVSREPYVYTVQPHFTAHAGAAMWKQGGRLVPWQPPTPVSLNGCMLASFSTADSSSSPSRKPDLDPTFAALLVDAQLLASALCTLLCSFQHSVLSKPLVMQCQSAHM
jgi:hypothetical protein